MSRTRVPAESLLAEGRLPLAELVALANRESRRSKPIYTGHKWFARRLGSSFRALLVAASETDEENFWSSYYGAADLTGWTVLDPFVGGGTSVFEASRLGARVVGRDVDAVACMVTSFELAASAIPDLTQPLADLQAGVGARVLPFHTLPDGRVVIHHFWVQSATCAACSRVYDAHPTHRLAVSVEDDVQWLCCPDCGEIVRRRAGAATFRCCGKRTPVTASVNAGVATCPYCQHSESLLAQARRLGTPQYRLLAAEVTAKDAFAARSVPMADRDFVTAAEVTPLYERAALEVRSLDEQHVALLPAMPIRREGRSDPRLIDYGYSDYTDLFNTRQLLHLRLLGQAVDAIEDADVRRALGTAFSAHLTTNCMMTGFAVSWRRLTPAFSIRAYRHMSRPVELNPWLWRTGRGTFPNAVEALGRASAFARSPREPRLEGGFVDIPVRAGSSHDVACGSASKLEGIPDESVDLVLTDPPYYDNIAYDELSDFFRCWTDLRGLTRPQDRPQLSFALRARRADAESREVFTERLGEAFSEVARVLKPDGLAAFTFQHSLAEGWAALADSIAASRLDPVGGFPLAGNGDVGLHASEGASTFDAVLVLKRGTKGAPQPLTVQDDDLAAAAHSVEQFAASLEGADRAFTRADSVNLWRALVVLSALRNRSPGMSLEDALQAPPRTLGVDHPEEAAS